MEKSATSGRRWLISGRVQGVGFRWFVLGIARDLGLSGTVRNLPDGRVEVEAQGDPSDLDRLKVHLAQGPPGARVHQVASEPVRHPGEFSEFRVLP
ncbi:MAG: acylphosphatase [Acidobacteriota bacterium]